MAIVDIFKKKKKPIEEAKPTEEEKKEALIERPVKTRSLRVKKIGMVYQVLKPPHITEKATDLVAKNEYVFKVWSGANKTEIKKAVEGFYGVKALAVKIIKISKRQRRIGKIQGWKKGYKKAVVKLKKGQKIEVLPR